MKAVSDSIEELRREVAELESQNESLRKKYRHALVRADFMQKQKTMFLANMSHEIRTPLNAILGFTDLLIEHPDIPDQYEILRRMRSSGQILLSILGDLLEMSSLESGTNQINLKPFSLSAMLESLSAYSDTLYMKGGNEVSLLLENKSKVPEVIISDEVRIKQVFFNLLTNAVKFTQKGTVRFGLQSACDESVRFYVKDNGPGISESDKKYIYNAFEQGTPATFMYGTGLGLYIVKTILERLNGKIEFETSVNKPTGTVFYFTVPVAKASSVEFHTVLNKPAKKLTRTKILVVEDNPVNALLVQRVLEVNGFIPVMAADGIEGLDAFIHNEDLLLVISDIVMPGMDGFAFLREVRKLEHEFNRPRRLPFIATSASTMKDEVTSYYEAGFDYVLPKPVEITNLMQIIQKCAGHAD